MARTTLWLLVLAALAAVLAVTPAAAQSAQFPFYPVKQKCTWTSGHARARGRLFSSAADPNFFLLSALPLGATDPFAFVGCFNNGTMVTTTTASPISTASFTLTMCAAACRSVRSSTCCCLPRAPLKKKGTMTLICLATVAPGRATPWARGSRLQLFWRRQRQQMLLRRYVG